MIRMIRSRRTLGIAIAALVLLLLGSGIYARIGGAGDESEDSDAAAAAEGVTTAAAGAFASDVAIPVEGVEAVRTRSSYP